MGNLKTVKGVLGFHENYKTANTVNNEGFPAWKREGVERLREILFLGNVGNTFYVDSVSNVLNKVKDLEELIVNSDIDVDIIKGLIVSARQEGFFRTMPILALVLLRKRDTKAFKEIFTDVILTGQDLKDFLDLNHQVFDGFGRSVKKAIHKWLSDKLNEFYAIKYRKDIADAVYLSRPKVDIFKNRHLLKYVYGAKRKINKETLKEIFENHKQIEGAEKFKVLISQGNINEAVNVAEENRLPADLMIGLAGNIDDKHFWKAVMKNMGLMQFIKYINKLVSMGLKEEVIGEIKTRITAENLRKAKIFPYRLFIAYINAKDEDVKSALEDTINKVISGDKIIDEKWTKYSWAICPDVSGSMTFTYRNRKSVKPVYISGFFSSVLAFQLNENEIYAWDDQLRRIIDVLNDKPINIYKCITEIGGYGTDMSIPIEHLTRNKIKKDIVVLITDEEHWVDYKGVKGAWKEYKERVNPNAKLVVIEVVGYGTSQVDEEFAQKYDVYTVFGWSDNVFKWIELKVLS